MRGSILFILLLLFSGASEILYAQSASLLIEGSTNKRVDKYTKTFKIRKRYSTEPLDNVEARVVLKNKTIVRTKSNKEGVYTILFDLQPNQTYYLTFSKNGYYPKWFKFNTNGISAKKEIHFKAWDFHMYKRVIGLPDSVFVIPTEFYYDSERGFMTYDESINLPLAVLQEKIYLDYLLNLNETDFAINEIEQESEVISKEKEEEEEEENEEPTSSIKKEDMPKIQLLDMNKLLNELNITPDSDSLIETKQTEISGEWQQLELAKMKATTEHDKSRISEAEKLLMEKEKQIKLAQTEIENAKKQIMVKEMENKNKNALLILASFVLLLVLALLFVLYRNNKERHRTNVLLSQKNKEVLDSIQYAKRLQTAILPPESILTANLKNAFVLYLPKDIVSGDFYWIENIGSKTLFAVVDCTGHGVPGAFMSIVAYNALNQAVNEHKLIKPSDILDRVNISISQTLHQAENIDVEDGMDISLCLLDTETGQFQFAGANHPLYLVRNNELKIIRGDKFSIGSKKANGKSFSNHNFSLHADDRVYIFSDGYADQFGGSKGKKMMYKKFREIIMQNNHEQIDAQREILNHHFAKWKGSREQVDDVCVMGIRL